MKVGGGADSTGENTLGRRHARSVLGFIRRPILRGEGLPSPPPPFRPGPPSIFGRLLQATPPRPTRAFNQPPRGHPEAARTNYRPCCPVFPLRPSESEIVPGPPYSEGVAEGIVARATPRGSYLVVLSRGSHGGFGRSMVRFLGGCRSLSNCFQRGFSSKSDVLLLLTSFEWTGAGCRI